MLAIVLSLASPLAVQAARDSGRTDRSSSPSQQVCAVFLSSGTATTSPEKRCSKPATATASFGLEDLNPVHIAKGATGLAGDAVNEVVGGAGDLIGGAVDSTIVAGFKAIIELLFGGLQSAITVALIKWIITIPDLSHGHVGSLEGSIAIGAGGLLTATMTISIVRFWGSGLTGDGAWAGAEGVARAAVAAALIGLWPKLFALGVQLSNALKSGILGDAVQAQLKDLFRDLDVIGIAGGGFTAGGIPMFLAIAIAIVGMLMLLALVAMKIVITAMTIVLFCAMPLAFVLWPIPELAGVLRLCIRSLAALLAIPVVWCLIFGAFAAIGADTFSFHNTGKDQGIFGTALNVAIVRPLVAISLLYLALVVPRRLLQVAPFMGGRGGGAVRHIATGAAIRAGFHYAPQVGAGAASGWAGNPLKQPSSPVGRAARTAAQGLRGSLGGGASTGGPSKLASQGTQPPKGAGPGTKTLPNRPKDSLNGMGESRGGAAQSAKARTAAGSQSTSTTAAAQGANGRGVQLAGGAFNGPTTINPSDSHNEAIAARRKEMKDGSRSGSAVTAKQLDGALGDLQNQPEFLGAARNAAFHKNPKEATGAYAEWSLSDNDAVTDQHKSAFSALGFASPKQRRDAFGRLDGGSGAPQPARPPQSGGAQANGRNGNGRIVPPSKPNSSGLSISRTPHVQPRGGGLDV
jgi:hypothetical protein